MFAYMYVCMYACTHMCIYIYIIYVDVHMCIYVLMNVDAYIYIHKYVYPPLGSHKPHRTSLGTAQAGPPEPEPCGPGDPGGGRHGGA